MHDVCSKAHSSHLLLHGSLMLVLLCICYVKHLSFLSRTHCWSWGCLWHLTGRRVSSQSPPLWMGNAKGIHLKCITTSWIFILFGSPPRLMCFASFFLFIRFKPDSLVLDCQQVFLLIGADMNPTSSHSAKHLLQQTTIQLCKTVTNKQNTSNLSWLLYSNI